MSASAAASIVSSWPILLILTTRVRVLEVSSATIARTRIEVRSLRRSVFRWWRWSLRIREVIWWRICKNMSGWLLMLQIESEIYFKQIERNLIFNNLIGNVCWIIELWRKMLLLWMLMILLIPRHIARLVAEVVLIIHLLSVKVTSILGKTQNF